MMNVLSDFIIDEQSMDFLIQQIKAVPHARVEEVAHEMLDKNEFTSDALSAMKNTQVKDIIVGAHEEDGDGHYFNLTLNQGISLRISARTAVIELRGPVVKVLINQMKQENPSISLYDAIETYIRKPVNNSVLAYAVNAIVQQYLSTYFQDVNLEDEVFKNKQQFLKEIVSAFVDAFISFPDKQPFELFERVKKKLIMERFEALNKDKFEQLLEIIRNSGVYVYQDIFENAAVDNVLNSILQQYLLDNLQAANQEDEIFKTNKEFLKKLVSAFVDAFISSPIQESLVLFERAKKNLIMQRFEVKNKDKFEQLLNIIRHKRDYFAEGIDENPQAYSAASQFESALNFHHGQFILGVTSFKEFMSGCQQACNFAQLSVLKEHRGWTELLANVCFILTIIPIFFMLYNLYKTGHFFYQFNTDSINKIEEIRQELDKINNEFEASEQQRPVLAY